jgi:hypothetical protein
MQVKGSKDILYDVNDRACRRALGLESEPQAV